MKVRDRIIAILIVVLLFIPLALPYQFQSGYWAESTLAWVIYILVGVILTVWIFFAFLDNWRSIMAEAEKEETHE